VPDAAAEPAGELEEPAGADDADDADDAEVDDAEE
jgi:hypothetical protein